MIFLSKSDLGVTKWRALGALTAAPSRGSTLARPRCTTRGDDAGRDDGLCTTRDAETTVRAGAETTCSNQGSGGNSPIFCRYEIFMAIF